MKINCDLEKIKDYGYDMGRNMLNVSYSCYGKIFTKQLDNVLNVNVENPLFIIEIDKETKNITLSVTTKSAFRSFSYSENEIVEPYIEDLIKDNLVDKFGGYLK